MSEKLERREFLKPLNIQSLYTEQRINALESRIDGLGYDVEYLATTMKGFAALLDRIERKLNHKSMETSGESIKIADEPLKNGGGE